MSVEPSARGSERVPMYTQVNRSGLRAAVVLVALCLAAAAVAAPGAEGKSAVHDTEKEDPKVAAKLAKPTPQQVEWADCEIGMFIHFAPNTWQDQEYDNHSTPLKKINPAKLDTDQWVSAAEAMGAKYIIFVAKHVGGFCMWQTETTDYGVRNIPWRGGKGDVLGDLATSCRKRGMKLGVYLSPYDRKQGAGSGGKCKTKEAQQRYDKIYRQQLAEVLSGYGEMFEVWFDGSNAVPVGDILAKHAPKAMVFQGPHATIRWVGNEAGVAPYPAWNSVSQAAGKSGVATARHGNPDGTAWLPNECDARIRSNWFWNTRNAPTLKTVDHLMAMYYRSVGHGAVLLLNHTPDTTGLIPAADVKRGAEFAAEVRRRFGKPLARTAGRGMTVVLKLPGGATVVDHVITMEDIAAGERVREYVVEGKVGARWREICRGTSVGHKKIDRFGPVSVSALRLRVLKAATTPMIRDFSAYGTGTVAAAREFFGHWKLDGIVKGCVTDSLGRQEPARVHGATLVSGRAGGKALHFDGRRSYVSLGKADVMDGDFTIAAWIRPDATTPGGPGVRHILSKERVSVGAFQMRLYLGAVGQPGFMLSDAGGGHIWPFETAGVKVPAGKWSHLAVTRKAAMFTLYLDGRKIASKKSPGTISHLNGLSLRLGACHAAGGDGPDSVFAGDIDDLVILGSALARKQIGELKDGKLPPIPAAGKKPADREFRVAGKWSGQTVKADWSDWTIDIAPFCDDAGQFEVVFRKTAGPGEIEVKALTAVFGQVEATRHVERAKADNTFYVNVPGIGTTLKIRATVRLGGGARCSGRVLIRRMPGK